MLATLTRTPRHRFCLRQDIVEGTMNLGTQTGAGGWRFHVDFVLERNQQVNWIDTYIVLAEYLSDPTLESIPAYRRPNNSLGN